MRDSLTLQCRCGAVRGKVTGLLETKPKRIVCYCDDCQAFPHYLGCAADVLDAGGGTEVLPAYPSQVSIIEGSEHLQCLRLSRGGLFRWYTSCCKTAVANCPPSFKMPYVGIIHSMLKPAADGTTADAALGPVHARILGKFGIRPLPQGTHDTAPLGVILMAVSLIAKGWIKGRYRPTPFFDAVSGKPRVEPYILTPGERENLRKLCGPR